MRNKSELIIIGGGIMGLFTAYYSSFYFKSITIIERFEVGNRESSSNGFTRSIRNDYLDPFYGRLAYEAGNEWLRFERERKKRFLINCGVLNIASRDFNSDLKKTYAYQSLLVLKKGKFRREKLNKDTLKKRFPQFQADMGIVDKNGGFLLAKEALVELRKAVLEKGVKIEENCIIRSIRKDKNGSFDVRTTKGLFEAGKVVVTAGRWVNDIYPFFADKKLPIRLEKPIESQYYIPKDKQKYSYARFPVFAYLDIGIYGHPIYDRETKGIKIGFYNPSGITKSVKQIKGIEEFVATCLPELKNSEKKKITDVDQCFYDLTPDNNFIVGAIPGYSNVYVGAGWCGTGFKFAPVIGKILTNLLVRRKNTYDICRFNPSRFT